jgi:hypothetical protein
LFVLSAGKLFLKLPDNVISRAYIEQLVKLSSSVGANYRAARRTMSDADVG